MNMTDFEKARAMEDLWIRGAEEIFVCGTPRIEKVEARPITIAEAWQKFLAQARARKLSRASIYKYDLLRRRMEDFAKRQGLYLLRDFNTDVLELFQSEWKGGDVTFIQSSGTPKKFLLSCISQKVDRRESSADVARTETKTTPNFAFYSGRNDKDSHCD